MFHFGNGKNLAGGVVMGFGGGIAPP